MPQPSPAPPVASLIPPDRFRRQPWKNGGGVTTEIAAVTDGDRLLWRVSVAEVTADQPFSLFPGLERILAVVEGAGLRLGVDGDPPVTVTPSDGAFRFRGEAPVTCALVGGPCRVFNLMFDRERLDGTLRRIAPGAAAEAPPGATSLVFATEAGLHVRAGGRTWQVPGGHALRLDGAGGFDAGAFEAGGGAPLLATLTRR